MREFVTKAIEMLRRKGADYGDIRVVKRQSEQLEVKNGRTESVTADREEGFGVRVIVNGSWERIVPCRVDFAGFRAHGQEAAGSCQP